ncbi:T9SS type A sorting domain-containing protein [Thalassobellus suaedae]|uniref:T9SS type A sorting domain-containing protein n=1 Tax=Thalassobellus suaedae TaxID=3074124 RepID=A0ABY9Y4K1_9FLAO|nr:T9SS type A sorting domain-containing protein [Flavobacteriaceae bacterium HL-DH10]
MKIKITFIFIAYLLLTAFAQAQGPPAPCGYFTKYACDDNNDGFTSFNLIELFPFNTFCPYSTGDVVEEDYHSIVYYESREDMNNEINPIANPEDYINISNPQTIFYRANAFNISGIFEFLTAENIIETSLLVPPESLLSNYDNDSDGLSIFDLTSVDVFCNSNDKNNYSVSYHLTYTDANSGANPIVNPSTFKNTTNPQYIYVRAVHNTKGNIETTNFIVKALFAVANPISDVYVCDSIDSFDLTSLDNTVLGNQNPNDFTISYYLSNANAEDKTNVLSNIFETLVDVTIFCRVEENTKRSYAITSFSFYISKTSFIAPLEAYEVCDDDGDGKATFDLASIRNKIIQDANYNYFDIAIYLDARNEIFISDQDSYINITNPQTIYFSVQDWGGRFDCFTILPLELVVQDCSTKGVIEINAFYDANTNDGFEANEINFLNGTLTYEENNDGVQHNLYSSNGIFNIISDDDTNTYDISYDINNEYDSCYNITTTSYDDISVINGSTVNYNFPINKVKDCGDIALYLTSYASPRPGFDYFNRLVIVNKGLETVTSGSVEFTNDSSVTFKNVLGIDSGNSVTNTSTGFRLDFVNLQPNQSEYVNVIMNVPVPTSLGTVLTNTVAYSVSDLNIENNKSTLSEVVIGSYDPNDIAESNGPEILYDDFTTDDYLYYTIRFQNVGTASAINVSIDNALDAKLDKSTIQMLNASHDYVFRRTNNLLNWKFDNIHLPSEDMDEPASHGYVYYKIKPLAGYKIGDVIPNTAEIYFDFNPAVITNTYKTEFVATLSNKKISDSEFSISPNPANNSVELSFGKVNISSINVKIYNIQGKQILKASKTLQNKSVILDVSKLKSGLYFIKVSDGISVTTKKLIIN